MNCLDALPVSERERRIRWAELLGEQMAAQELLNSLAQKLSRACAALDEANEAIAAFKKERGAR